VDSNAILTVSGNTTLYVANDLLLNSDAQFIVAEGSDVEVYVDGRIFFDSNTQVNNLTLDPKRLQFWGTDNMVDNGGEPAIELNSNHNIYATVVAKNATVSLDSNVAFFGAIMSDRLHMNSNACIHYDESLNSDGSGPSKYVMISWKEI